MMRPRTYRTHKQNHTTRDGSDDGYYVVVEKNVSPQTIMLKITLSDLVSTNRKDFRQEVANLVSGNLGIDTKEIRVYYTSECLDLSSWSKHTNYTSQTHITVHVKDDIYFQRLLLEHSYKNLPKELVLEKGVFYPIDSNKESYRTAFIADSDKGDNADYFRSLNEKAAYPYYYKWYR